MRQTIGGVYQVYHVLSVVVEVEKRNNMKTNETKEEFIELRAKGYSLAKIAQDISVSKRTLIDWSKELEEEIANRKAVELEALYEKHYMLKEHRIELFGGLLSKLKDELSTRDLYTVPTDKLVDMLMKCSNHLRDEFTEMALKSSAQIQTEKSNRQFIESLG